MLEYVIENEERAKGNRIICGVDEAGRGCLCGRVYAAAVILPDGYENARINDSKKLSEKVREQLFYEIVRDAVCGIGYAEVEEIERLNILNAAMLAMRRAIDALGVNVDIALIDGNTSRDFECNTRTVVKGDSISPSIAAASVLAKVSRDRYITDAAREFPQYGFEKHKGYCTKAHVAAIHEYGPCILHRPSFLKKI